MCIIFLVKLDLSFKLLPISKENISVIICTVHILQHLIIGSNIGPIEFLEKDQ
jgi:hypothetical protein